MKGKEHQNRQKCGTIRYNQKLISSIFKKKNEAFSTKDNKSFYTA